MVALLGHVLKLPALAVLLAGLLGGAAPAAARGAQAPVAPADSLRVFLLTIGQGEAVWERFGHNALWIHDPGAGTDIAYHWGLFDMSEAGFLVEFLQGRMVYSMGAADAQRLVDAYRAVGRDVTIQELALTVPQAAALQAFVQWNVLPENRRYRYDYFRDNCSTRVRDALDDALGGVLRSALARPAAHTYRSQALALTAEDRLLTTGIDLGLGPLGDQAITRWELAFVPMRLRDDLRSITVSRPDGDRPLVVAEREVAAPGSPAGGAGSGPPDGRAGPALLVGLLAAGAILGLARVAGAGRASKRARAIARWLLAGLGSAWGLLAGVLGLIVLALWAATDHEFAWRNENLLQVNPLALALAVLVPLSLGGRGGRWPARVAGLLLGLSLLGLAIHPLPVTSQANLAVIGLIAPIHGAVFYVLWRAARDGMGGGDGGGRRSG